MDALIAPGHNEAPIEELLREETEQLRARATSLIESLNNSKIDSPEAADQVVTLGVMLKDFRETVEVARRERTRPIDQQKAAIQRAYKAEIIDVLDAAMTQARDMVNRWRRQQEVAAEAERRKRDEEAAAARAAADKLAQDKRDAEAAGDPNAALKAELAEIQARDRAEALEGEEGTIRPGEIIHTSAGAAITTTRRVPVVTNIGLCLRWLIENQSAALIEAITPVIARLSRAKVAIPGVEVREEQGTSFRR